MTLHRSPVRRAVRQRSGHKVAGTGSTAKIVNSILLTPVNGVIQLKFSSPVTTVPQLFLRDLGVIGAGFYLYTSSESTLSMNFSWEYDGELAGECNIDGLNVKPEKWGRFGVLEQLEIEDETIFENLEFEINIETADTAHLFGVVIGGLNHEYYEAVDIYDAFNIKTELYIPEVLYLNPEGSDLDKELLVGEDSGDGLPLVLKSCNRCTRFLPVDMTDEKNALGYSRHHRDLECTHKSFSKFKIEGEHEQPELAEYIEDGFVKSFSGFQLECRPCKKIFVNEKLNAMRDQTQHREDGLRRRAFEPLAHELVPGDFSYKKFEMANKKAFDVHIWDKFERKCFNCGRDVSMDKNADKSDKMNIDHTRPLAFLWRIDESATCLCGTCNGSKLHKFPIEFYTDPDKLEHLASVVGISIEDLSARKINEDVMDELINRIEWFFDAFLAHDEYQKERKGKRTSDLILHALHNSIKIHNAHNENKYPVDLVNVYVEATGRVPKTVDTTD